MLVRQSLWRPDLGWESGPSQTPADLALVFGLRSRFEDADFIQDLRDRHPAAVYAGCSTAGEIHDTQVHLDSVTVTSVNFDHARVRSARADLDLDENGYAAGRLLGEELSDPALRSVMVFSDGVRANGSELARGLNEGLPPGTLVTGGLAGDGADFGRTAVLSNHDVAEHAVVAVGFYGDRLLLGHGSLGGWDPFGPERVITGAEGNVLTHVDDQPALDLYKRYLGDYAAELPSSALLFPLSIRPANSDRSLVRTVLGIDDEAGTMTFAGDMPVGAYARMMKANFDRLVDGAVQAAQASAFGETPAQLAVLISCVGRRLVLGQRVEEEVEGVREALGDRPVLTGFYSYGELSPLARETTCELHNQTMTITTLAEI